MASKEICCLRGFVTGITSTADYGVDSDSDVFITTGSVSRFFLWEYLSWFLSLKKVKSDWITTQGSITTTRETT